MQLYLVHSRGGLGVQMPHCTPSGYATATQYTVLTFLVTAFNRTLYCIEQMWPNWGPPKIFCGSCSKILIMYNVIYGHNLEWNRHKLMYFGLTWDKHTKKIVAARSAIYLLKIGPRAKKSGHPWYRTKLQYFWNLNH